jgi:predicted RNA-binding protein with PIN domain
MHYLIDGYNLLYAMGVLHGRAGPTGLQKARLALLGLLKSTYGDEAATVTVVFDAAHAFPGATEVQEYEGIQVRFAVQEQEADDLIEAIIRQDSVPRQLTVVSDDHRLQKAARRRKCIALGCGDYLDWLTEHRRQRRQDQVDTPAKPTNLSEHETNQWLREFADLREDPALRQLSDPVEWQDLDKD